jgi:hypothetical protein
MLALAEPVTQEHLSAAATKINDICQGLDAERIASLPGQVDVLEQDVLRLIVDDMHR